MTRINAYRQLISKLKKALNNNDPNLYLLDRVQSYVQDNYCDKCVNEDFGYCGLRRSPLSREIIALKYCMPAAIKYLETKLPEYKKGETWLI